MTVTPPAKHTPPRYRRRSPIANSLAARADDPFIPHNADPGAPQIITRSTFSRHPRFVPAAQKRTQGRLVEMATATLLGTAWTASTPQLAVGLETPDDRARRRHTAIYDAAKFEGPGYILISTVARAARSQDNIKKPLLSIRSWNAEASRSRAIARRLRACTGVLRSAVCSLAGHEDPRSAAASGYASRRCEVGRGARDFAQQDLWHYRPEMVDGSSATDQAILRPLRLFRLAAANPNSAIRSCKFLGPVLCIHTDRYRQRVFSPDPVSRIASKILAAMPDGTAPHRRRGSRTTRRGSGEVDRRPRQLVAPPGGGRRRLYGFNNDQKTRIDRSNDRSGHRLSGFPAVAPTLDGYAKVIVMSSGSGGDLLLASSPSVRLGRQ